MRQIVAAVAAACAVAGTAGAGLAQTAGQPAAMPGQVVGSTYTLRPAGNMIPRSVAPAGNPIGSPFAKPELGATINPFAGTNVDPKLLAAPAMGYPGSPYSEPDLIDKLYDKLKSVTAFLRPSPAATPTYTPGISRRNKERAMERTWRRD